MEGCADEDAGVAEGVDPGAMPSATSCSLAAFLACLLRRFRFCEAV